LVMVTVAFAMVAPELSVTVPSMVPTPACPYSAPGEVKRIKAKNRLRGLSSICFPSGCYMITVIELIPMRRAFSTTRNTSPEC